MILHPRAEVEVRRVSATVSFICLQYFANTMPMIVVMQKYESLLPNTIHILTAYTHVCTHARRFEPCQIA